MSAKIDSRQIISISADVKRAMLDACAKDIDIAATILTDAVKNGSKYYGVVMEVVLRMPNTWPLNLWEGFEFMIDQRSHPLH